MKLHLASSQLISRKTIIVTGSKSETNRLLLLQSLYPEITVRNISRSDDSDAMQMALASTSDTIDIHHAGTAMRFLTAYFSTRENREIVLTGSARMQERPIGILVDALRQIGADISYEKNEGFPPLRIRGKKLEGGAVSMKADVSSQFISALLLIAPSLEKGLQLTLEGKITSVPYLKMTLSLLEQCGVKTDFSGNQITIYPKQIGPMEITVESDWSSASYFFSIVALSDVGSEIQLQSYRQDSLQGDSALVELYKDFGVTSEFESGTLTIRKTADAKSHICFDLNNTPDIAQTIAVTAFGLGISCELSGLHTLKIKETDRLEALKTELGKLGAAISVTDDSLSLEASDAINPGIAIDTYNDHRMAMAFAPLALRVPIMINNADVVSKSFPTFWEDLKRIGLTSEEI